MARAKSLDPQILQAALEGLELQKQRLARHMDEVRRLLGTEPRKAAVVGEAARQPRRTINAAGRKHIAAVQRKRWAEWRKKKASAAKK